VECDIDTTSYTENYTPINVFCSSNWLLTLSLYELHDATLWRDIGQTLCSFENVSCSHKNSLLYRNHRWRPKLAMRCTFIQNVTSSLADLTLNHRISKQRKTFRRLHHGVQVAATGPPCQRLKYVFTRIDKSGNICALVSCPHEFIFILCT